MGTQQSHKHSKYKDKHDRSEAGAKDSAEVEIFDTFATRGSGGRKIVFKGNEDKGSIGLSLLVDKSTKWINIPAADWSEGVIELFHTGNLRFSDEAAKDAGQPADDMVFRLEGDKVNFLWFRHGQPRVELRTFSARELSLSYAIAIGVSTGNYLARADIKADKDKEKEN